MKIKNKVEGIILPDFKLIKMAAVTKTVWYWWRDRHIDQCNRKGNPEVDPHKYVQLVFDRGEKVSNGEKIALPANGAVAN